MAATVAPAVAPRAPTRSAAPVVTVVPRASWAAAATVAPVVLRRATEPAPPPAVRVATVARACTTQDAAVTAGPPRPATEVRRSVAPVAPAVWSRSAAAAGV